MRSSPFTFKFGYVCPTVFKGNISYEWIKLHDKKELVVHSVNFDHLRGADVRKLTAGPFYDYLVDCAKAECDFGE